MPDKLIHRTYKIDEEVHNEFKVICAKKRKSMGSFIREWVKKFIEENKER